MHEDQFSNPTGNTSSKHDNAAVGGRFTSGSLIIASVLSIIILVALSLRLFGIDWDQRGLFHPDERAILASVSDIQIPSIGEVGDLLDPAKSPLNPGWFAYGSFPIYLLKTVQIAASPFTDWDIWQLRFPGRAISALADTSTVAVVFFIGLLWFGRRVAILASALTGLAVLHIQQAHFFVVDPLLTLLVVATVFFLVRIAHTASRKDSVLAGLVLGLAMATKISVAPIGIAVIAAYFIYAISSPGDVLKTTKSVNAARRGRAIVGLIFTTTIATTVFVVAQPYALIDWNTFFASISEQSEMVRGIRDYPYTRQYIDTTPYWYHIKQLATFGLGPVTGILAWLGLLGATWFTAVHKRKTDLVIMAWVLPYLLLTGWFDVKFLRYLLPITPFLILYGARLIFWIGDSVQRLIPLMKHTGSVLAVLALLAAMHYALAFMSIYSERHPAQDVSAFLKDNARPGSIILKEHWEEGIPNTYGYHWRDLELYNMDSEAKFDAISNDMAKADYLVFYSHRLYATIPRLAARYPISTKYYGALFEGHLGYELAFVSENTPTALGISYRNDPLSRVDLKPPSGYELPSGALASIDMGWADESFTVYEHPISLVFANTKHLSRDEIRHQITIFQASGPTDPGLLLTSSEALRQQSGGTWDDVVFSNHVPIWLLLIIWLAAIQMIAIAALPFCLALFRPLPDRGYLLSKTLGILIVATITWLFAGPGGVAFSQWSVILSLAIMAAVSGLVWQLRRAEIAVFLRARWRLILAMEAVFILAFVVFLVIRAANPDLWHPFRGGEKPMDFAYLNAVTRSTVMPPYDPWFAGGFLNYYYFGQFIVGSLIRLTGIAPSIAYNLAIPTLFAMTTAGVVSIIYNLAEGSRRLRGERRFSWSPFIAAIGGSIVVAVSGNIDGMIQLLEGAGRALSAEPFGLFDYWRSSRMMAPNSEGFEITEFPFFTFLFADLHAHLIAIPFSLLALGLCLNIFVRVAQPPSRWIGTLVSLAVLGLVIGALRIINAWDYPTSLAIATAVILASELVMGRKGRGISMRLFATVAKVLLVAAIGYLVFLPFHARFELFNNGIEHSQFHTPLWRFLMVHSLFIFVIVSYLIYEAQRSLKPLFQGNSVCIYRRGVRKISLRIDTLLFSSIVPAAALVAFALMGYGTVAFNISLVTSISILVALVFHRRERDGNFIVFVALMAMVALILTAGVDLITVKGDIGRMNTVFKFYLQAWILLGIASSFIVWRLWSDGFFSLDRMSMVKTLWLGAFAVLLVSVMVYPVLGTRARLSDRFETGGLGLDGMAFMDRVTYSSEQGPLELRHDAQAIRWLQNNVIGSPVILEGLTNLYRWGNRISIYTGLPTVIGWDWHQRQQRAAYEGIVMQRRADVNQIYTTRSKNMALDLLKKYGVRLVVVGELENYYYPPSGIAKFDQMEPFGLSPVYRNKGVTIYEFKP